MREFEFERDWPRAFRFVGPLTDSPPFSHVPPEFPPGKRWILVSLGTHLPWARARAAALTADLARQLPDCVFHLSLGKPGSTDRRIQANVHRYGYIPYDRYLPRYHAALIHGGTGITYSCIKAAVPMLVWPQDYDQFDHAARIVHRGLGLRLSPLGTEAATSLQRLLADATIQARVRQFQGFAQQYNPHQCVLEAFQKISGCPVYSV
jgi:UDP:flavonoid glycosyltransferase YjiC (YdhE family)